MLKKLKIGLLTLFIALICTACPYQTPVPISEAALPIDEELLGRWKDDAKNKKEFIEISKKDATHYRIVQHKLNEELQVFEKNEMSGHLSKVNDTLYINLLQRNGYFHPYKIRKVTNKHIKLFPLSDHIKEKFEQSTALQSYIAQYQHLSFFFGNEMEMLKDAKE
jgi:hypothetical protein